MARTFNGFSSVISTADSSTHSGYGTWFAKVRRAAGATGQGPLLNFKLASGSTPLFWVREHSQSDVVALSIGGTVVQATTVNCLNTDGWAFLACTKATGTTTPRFHKYLYSSNVWSHENAGSTIADAANATGYFLGANDLNGTKNSWWEGDIAWLGFIGGTALSDALIESYFPFSLAGIAAANPAVFWILDQQATAQTVLDLTGHGANETAQVATTVSTFSEPLFTYGLPTQRVTKQPAAAGGGAAGPRDLLLLRAG